MAHLLHTSTTRCSIRPAPFTAPFSTHLVLSIPFAAASLPGVEVEAIPSESGAVQLRHQDAERLSLAEQTEACATSNMQSPGKEEARLPSSSPPPTSSILFSLAGPSFLFFCIGEASVGLSVVGTDAEQDLEECLDCYGADAGRGLRQSGEGEAASARRASRTR
jgi:hypothetical protein